MSIELIMNAQLSPSHNLFKTYNRAKPIFERGDGAWLYAADGQKYLDFTSGIAVNALGHHHPHLVNALKSAADGIWHLSNLFEIPDQTKLAERLCAHSFADRVFMTNSGAEALECAIKTARKYFATNGQPEKHVILTFEGAFHGRTLATIAAGGQAKYLDGFGPKVQGFEQIPFADHEAFQNYDLSNVAAVLIEPIQGEGGIRIVPDQCLRGIRERCDDTGTLLIFDEIQSGIGRAGTLFAHEASGISPDILASAKGLGGGFPVGACLATEEVAACMVAGTHGTTFGGNPLAMAVANAVLDVVLDDKFLENVQTVSAFLRQGLDGLVMRHPAVFKQLRGRGLLLGLECVPSNLDVLAAINDQKMLAVPAGENVIRLLPPLIISIDEASEALARLEQAANALTERS